MNPNEEPSTSDEIPPCDSEAAFKNDFTHAISIAESVFKEEGMLLPNPSDKASVAARAMGETFHAAILDMIIEY